MKQPVCSIFFKIYSRALLLFAWRLTTRQEQAQKNYILSAFIVFLIEPALRKISLQRMLLNLLLCAILMGVCQEVASAQAIKVASIDQSRYSAYSLNGSFMVNALAKLTNTANFGPSGMVNRSLNITHTFGTVGSIKAASLANYDVLFIGMIDDNRSSSILTPSETQAIYTWSQQPGKVVIVAEQPYSQPLTNQYGYGLSNQISNPTTPTQADATSNVKIFSGVFGSAPNISQAGTSQGFFSTNCSSIVLAKNASGNPSILLDTRQRDVLLGDTDFFTSVSGAVTAGGAISSDADKTWANLWAWAVNEVITPGTSTNTSVAAFTVAATPSPGCSTGSGSLTFTSPIGTASNGQPFEYSIDGGATYQGSPVFTNIADGTYSIYARAGGTCATSAGAASGGTIKVNVVPLVTIAANPGLIIATGQSTKLTAAGATSYNWSTGAATPDITTSTAGVYSVTGTRGICSATASVTVVSGTVVNGPVCDNFVTTSYAGGLSSSFVFNIFAVTGPGSATVYAATSEGPNISTDGGQTFTNGSFFWNDAAQSTVSGVKTLYFATYSGLQISTDNGQTFTTRTTANGLGSDYLNRVYATGSNVYASTTNGLSISTDGGATFTNRTTANGLAANDVQEVFALGSTIYVATSNANGANGSAFNVSTDGGQTFTTRGIPNGLGSMDQLNGLPIISIYAVGNTVYVGTGFGLYISTDGGQTFFSRTSADGLGGDGVSKVQVIGNVIYAATNGGLSISTDGGNTFTNKTTANGLGSDNLSDLYVTNSSIYLATQGGGVSFCPPVSNTVLTLLASGTPDPVCMNSPLSLSASVTGGTAPYSYTWAAPAGVTLSATSTNAVSATATMSGIQTFTITVSDASSTPLTSTTTLDVTVNAAPTVTIAANPGLNITQGQSIILTASGATSYTWSTGATTADISTSTAGTYSVTGVTGICSATASVAVTVSGTVANGSVCDTYVNKTMADGLADNLIYGVYATGNTVYASTENGLSTSVDGGNSFTTTPASSGLGLGTVFSTYVVGNTVYAAKDGGLGISTDGGVTCTLKTTNNGLGSNTVFEVLVIGNTIYAATYGGVSISTDGGNTFVNRTTADGLGNNRVFSILTVGNTVYAATESGLSISTDGGATFTNKTTANGLGDNFVRDIYVVGGTIYVATEGGLSISTDGGNSFINKTTANGLGGIGVEGVVVVGNTIYAATNGGLSISTDGGNNFINKTTTNGLGDNTVRGVSFSGNSIYAATGNGVSFCYPAPILTNFTASTTSACAGQPISFSASIANAAAPFAYTLTNGSTTQSGTSASATVFSQSLTASGSGVQTFTLTVSTPGGSTQSTTDIIVNTPPNVSLTANGVLSQSNPSVTLTATPGAATYLFSTGATQVNNGNTATVTTPGLYSVTLTDGNGCSATASTTVSAPSPDLTLLVYVRPAAVHGNTQITVVVDVVELNGVATNGLITVKINRDATYNLTLPASATSVGSRTVQNNLWQLDSSDPSYYSLTTTSVIQPGGQLPFGLTGSMTPNATRGSLSISSVIDGGSGGETKVTNNVDADRIDYFQL